MAPSDPEREPRRGVARTAWHLLVAVAGAIAAGWRRLMVWNRRGGADRSGLARLAEIHALQAAGDASVTVALAGSLFFSVPTHEARTRVALYLILTMAPFALVAPVLGPLLDRFRRGRRLALATTMVARATLALVIGHSLATHLTLTDKLALYPAALGVLVASKTYTVTRSAAVPRLLPPSMTLVQANSRLTLIGVIAPGVAGGFSLLVIKVAGHLWALRLGALVYLTAAVFALLLPRRADGGADVRASEGHLGVGNPLRLGQIDVVIGGILRSAASLRWLNGFLLFYGAFVVREHHLAGLSDNVSLGALAIGIGAGNFLGTTVGARVANHSGPRLAATLLAVTCAVTVLTAVDFGLLTVFGEAVIAAGAAAMLKLGLDATIQQRVDDSVRTSTFARSETTMQLAWVVGGAVGILLPTRPAVGFAVAATAVAAALVLALGFATRRRGGSVPAKVA